MKLPTYLAGLFCLLLCFSVSDLNAQRCSKSKSSCSKYKNQKRTDNALQKRYERSSYRYLTNQSPRSSYRYKYCDKSKSSKSKYYDEYKSEKAKKVMKKKNFAGLLVGAATLLDTDETAFTAGIEYERYMNRMVGIGISSEFTLSEDPSIMLGIPLSIHPTKRLRLFASPLASFQEQTVVDRTVPVAADEVVTVSEWNTEFGGRLGVSYYLSANGLRIAPMVRADLISGNVRMNYGISAGIGF